ncbi:fimbria/pilus periplasmic chaperone [Salmonella enterica]|nr:hypothetical protein [Salmonella enterica subsp. enterica serovar Bareilly]EHE8230998.1 fimbria/pilus periplasmic chaperone [Salmonella enterica]
MRNYRQWLVFSKVILTLLGLTGWYGPAQAAVNIDRTRIIFASDDVAQSLTLSNENTTPMWYMSLTLTMDNKKSIGDIMVAPKTALDVPLTRSPTPGASINYAVINDSGNWRQYTAILEKYISKSDFIPEF